MKARALADYCTQGRGIPGIPTAPPPPGTPVKPVPAPTPVANKEAAERRTTDEQIEQNDNINNSSVTPYLLTYTTHQHSNNNHICMACVTRELPTLHKTKKCIMVLDSAATKHMLGFKKLFATLKMFPPEYYDYVILGDDKT
eukprot:3608147-Ditylum_brightwellii.AAC.1